MIGKAAEYHERSRALASRIINHCSQHGYYCVGAESLTGGLVASSFVDVPGASAVFLGSAVTYALSAKIAVLGVSSHLLEQGGAVQCDVAERMAMGAICHYVSPNNPSRDGGCFSPPSLQQVIALSTTGVAGPSPDAEHPVGEVFTSVSIPRSLIDMIPTDTIDEVAEWSTLMRVLQQEQFSNISNVNMRLNYAIANMRAHKSVSDVFLRDAGTHIIITLHLYLTGDRLDIRHAAVCFVLELLNEVLDNIFTKNKFERS